MNKIPNQSMASRRLGRPAVCRATVLAHDYFTTHRRRRASQTFRRCEPSKCLKRAVVGEGGSSPSM
eukprot:4525225-Pyramimonas_sp.AAC.1